MSAWPKSKFATDADRFAHYVQKSDGCWLWQGYRDRKGSRNRKLKDDVMVGEQHEQWVGLAYLERHGLPGYPAPIPRERTDEQRIRQRDAQRKRRASERKEWGEA